MPSTSIDATYGRGLKRDRSGHLHLLATDPKVFLRTVALSIESKAKYQTAFLQWRPQPPSSRSRSRNVLRCYNIAYILTNDLSPLIPMKVNFPLIFDITLERQAGFTEIIHDVLALIVKHEGRSGVDMGRTEDQQRSLLYGLLWTLAVPMLPNTLHDLHPLHRRLLLDKMAEQGRLVDMRANSVARCDISIAHLPDAPVLLATLLDVVRHPSDAIRPLLDLRFPMSEGPAEPTRQRQTSSTSSEQANVSAR